MTTVFKQAVFYYRNAVNFTTATAATEYPTGDKTILTLTFPPSTKGISTDQFDLK